jgi:hypothetical protein
MKFRITIDGDVYKLTEVETSVKLTHRIYLDAKNPYEVPVGFTPGVISCEHDIEEGSYEAMVEVFAKTGHVQKNCKIIVEENKIIIEGY